MACRRHNYSVRPARSLLTKHGLPRRRHTYKVRLSSGLLTRYVCPRHTYEVRPSWGIRPAEGMLTRYGLPEAYLPGIAAQAYLEGTALLRYGLPEAYLQGMASPGLTYKVGPVWGKLKGTACLRHTYKVQPAGGWLPSLSWGRPLFPAHFPSSTWSSFSKQQPENISYL